MIQDTKGHKTFGAKETSILHNAENRYKPHNHADTLTVARWPINPKWFVTLSPHLATGVYNPLVAV